MDEEMGKRREGDGEEEEGSGWTKRWGREGEVVGG